MFTNYFKTALRNLFKNKAHSTINILGLAIGMAVSMLIGLWIWDELSFNKYHKNYDRIAKVMQHQTFNGEIGTWESMPQPVGKELRETYGSNFKRVVMSTWDFTLILASGDKTLYKTGKFMDTEAPDMLSLQMLKGSRAGLKDPASVLLSASVAKAYFGDADPMGKLMKINNKFDVKVTGVYEDFPHNSSFARISYIAPWQLWANQPWMKEGINEWGNNSFQVFVQIADNTDMSSVSAAIKDAKLKKIDKEDRRYNPRLFLQPMRNWHLYSNFKNGVNAGGRIQYVWMFAVIGIFVLLLACINFMNLSTARSEKRAKEVGIRKAIGSLRGQLIYQFFSESLVVVAFAFISALLIVQLTLPLFNEVADKKMTILWNNPVFWIACIGFSLITGLIAGSYPALYLSSFQPVKVLKGTFRVGRFAAIPRKVLVVMQFTVSVTLIIGTIVVFRQIQYAKNRPVGYNRDGLLMIEMSTSGVHDHFETVRNELKSTGAIAEMAEAGSPLTSVRSTNGTFNWEGKDPNLAVDFPNTGVSYDYGKTVGWQFIAGRDFSRDFASDSLAFVLTESAVKYMGLKDPVGKILQWEDQPFTIIGVIKDMIVESPYNPVRPSLYCMAKNHDNVAILRINPAAGTREALGKIEKAFKKYNPAQPFEYKFVDEEYARKFSNEERVGKLAAIFAVLAIFISCLGLFGMASFMAEQRIKEIGIRKVLGASIYNVWRLLSKDFVLLVIISLLIAIPTAWYFMTNWLQNYQYRSNISWWIFAAAGMGALLITILTVSFQAIKAALANPVRSLRSE
jgi:putative ABC transport system permease protein